MSLETRITEAATAAVSRLDEDFRTRLASLSDELRTAAASAAAEAEAAHAETTVAFEREIAALRAELDQRHQHVAALDAEADAARDTHGAELALLRRTAADIFIIGKGLIRAKKELPDGFFGRWAFDELGLTSRTAQRR